MEKKVCSNIFARNITVTPPSGKTANYACDNVRLIHPVFLCEEAHRMFVLGGQNNSWAPVSVTSKREFDWLCFPDRVSQYLKIDHTCFGYDFVLEGQLRGKPN